MKMFFMRLKTNQPKNRAHLAAQKLAKNYADCLIDEKRLEEFREMMKRRIDQINREHPRCGDIKLWLEKPVFMADAQQISIEGNFYLLIREVKRFELSKPKGRDPIYDLMGDMKAH